MFDNTFCQYVFRYINKDLKTSYRKQSPDASITIKLHLVEVHVLQFI